MMAAAAPCHGSDTGACCFRDGGCIDTDEADCNAMGGDYQGDGTECFNTRGDGIICPIFGACCYPDGSCVDEISATECLDTGGNFQGALLLCADGRGTVACEPAPPNDNCDGAIMISTLGVPVDGSTDWSFDDDVPACVFIGGFPPRGVWYTVTGTGTTMEASVCGLAEDPLSSLDYLGIYCGPCDDIRCVAGVRGDADLCPDQGTLTVQWCSEAGLVYHILVGLRNADNGDFTLNVTDIGQSCIPDPCFPPNDECENAAVVSPGATVPGTTDGATSDPFADCSNQQPLDPGVWYTIEGTGNPIKLELCGVGEMNARGGKDPLFAGEINVYCGACNELMCVASEFGSLVACDLARGPGSPLEVEWCSALNRTYFIHVSFTVLDTGEGGDFELSVSEMAAQCDPVACSPPNDDCAQATPLIPDAPAVAGSVLGATDDPVPLCDEVERGVPSGVWYRTVGTGSILEIGLCSVDGPGTDALVAVFCESCADLQCIDQLSGPIPPCNTQTDPEPGERLSWCAEMGREYFIFVGLRDSSGDNFEIRLRDLGLGPCLPTACTAADFCVKATEVCPGAIYSGHTFSATSDYLDHGAPFDTIFFCGMFFGLYDVWYKYEPAEAGLLFVHVEGPPTEYVFGVYDSCSSLPEDLLACNIARHHGVVITWVQPETTYYIRIAGYATTRGEFQLDLVGPDCAEIPYNLSE